MTEQQVRQIWAQQWAKIKPNLEAQSGERYAAQVVPGKNGALPELWTGYGAAYRQREAIRVHMESGEYPGALFRDRAPNQSQDEFEYIRKNYEQTTLDVALDFENTIARAIHRGNYSVEWEQGDAVTEEIREYVEGGIKEWGTLNAFVQRVVIRLKLQDAMGVLSFIPRALNVAVEPQEDGTEVVRMDGVVRPDIIYTTSPQVWGFEYDSWYLLRMNDSAEVTFGGRTVPGVLCLLVDGVNVWTIRQVGKKSDWQFEYTEFYEHALGEPPCIHLGGTLVVKEGKPVFESPFLPAVGPLNLALKEEQYLQASIVKTMYPQVVMVGDACDFLDQATGVQCFEGKLRMVDDNGALVLKTCPSCKGSGKMRRLGPLNELIVNKGGALDGGGNDGINATNAMAHISPAVGSLQFKREDIDHNKREARRVLHLHADAPMGGGDSKTATEAGLNNRAKDAFVKPIAEQILRIEEFGMRMIGRQIAGADWDGFTMRMPTQFDLRTEADRIAEISAAREAGLYPAIIDEMEGDLIAARYAGDEWMAEAMEVIQRSDRLARMQPQTIIAEAAAGRVEPWEILLHYAALDIYRELYDTDAAFAAAGLWDKVLALHEKAKTRATMGTSAGSPALRALRQAIEA